MTNTQTMGQSPSVYAAGSVAQAPKPATQPTPIFPDYVVNSGLETRLSDNQISLFRKKYLHSHPVMPNLTPSQRLYLVASEVAKVEKKYGMDDTNLEDVTRQFFNAMVNMDFLPGGRVLANAATEIKALNNCYVLPIEDDLEKIYEVLKKAAIVHKNGGGTGYNFSTLRPRGYKVKHGIASGPVSFATQFDRETEIITSGNRRGANMGILNINHPDIFEFIEAKQRSGVLTNFNVSIGVTDDFMKAYNSNGYYRLNFDGQELTAETLKSMNEAILKTDAGAAVGKKPIPHSLSVGKDNQIYNLSLELDLLGRVQYDQENRPKVKKSLVGKVSNDGYVEISAEKVFRKIAESAHKKGEPGVIFLDEIERGNMLKADGPLSATNPCGEQPLHKYGACNLGSVNLANMVRSITVEPNKESTITTSTTKYFLDEARLESAVRTGVRFLDNVNDLNKGPIKEIEDTVLRQRRMGLGVMGFADLLVQLGIPYDSEAGIKIARQVMKKVNDIAYDESLKLAQQKGAFPAFKESSYPQDKPIRNLSRTTIAPTGSIATFADASSGVEPIYTLIGYKKIRGGDNQPILNKYFSQAIEQAGLDINVILAKVEANGGSCQGIEEIPEQIRYVFKTAHDIKPEMHVRMQAAFQENTENAISKTINMSKHATVEDVLNAYVLAHKSGCKGVTVYRDGSLDNQVLVTSLSGRGQTTLLTQLIEQELAKPRPGNVKGRTDKIRTPYGGAFLTVNFVTDEFGNKIPYEVFMNIGKAGGDIPAIAQAFGRLISTSVRGGIPLEALLEQLDDIGGETQAGMGSQKVKSLPDSIAKGTYLALQLEGLIPPKEDKHGSGEEVADKSPDLPMPAVKINSKQELSGNLCPKCGKPLIRQDSCQKCSSPDCDYSQC